MAQSEHPKRDSAAAPIALLVNLVARLIMMMAEP